MCLYQDGNLQIGMHSLLPLSAFVQISHHLDSIHEISDMLLLWLLDCFWRAGRFPKESGPNALDCSWMPFGIAGDCPPPHRTAAAGSTTTSPFGGAPHCAAGSCVGASRSTPACCRAASMLRCRPRHPAATRTRAVTCRGPCERATWSRARWPSCTPEPVPRLSGTSP